MQTSLSTEAESDKPLIVHDEQTNNDTQPSATPDVPTSCASSTDDEATAPELPPPVAAASTGVDDSDAAPLISIPPSDESVAVAEPPKQLALVDAADEQSECTDSPSGMHIPSASAPEIARVEEPKPALPEKPWESDDEEETGEETAVTENRETEPSADSALGNVAVQPPDDLPKQVLHNEEGSLELNDTTDDANVVAGSDFAVEVSAADTSSDIVAQLSSDAKDIVSDDVGPDDCKTVISDEVTAAASDDVVVSAVSGNEVEKKRKSKKPKKVESMAKDGEEPEEEEAKKSKKSGKLKKKSKKKDDEDVVTELADSEQQEN